MKRKYIILLSIAIILNVLFFVVPISLFPDLINGGYYSRFTSSCIWSGLFDFAILIFAINSGLIFDMPYEVISNKGLVWNLARNDFKVKYVGSYLGIFWSFINPLVTILLYWIVFQFAFRSGDVDGHPFVLWLVAGLVPWILIQDAITNGTNALLEYAYLVKKVMFKISILPSIKIFSTCIVHAVFVFVAIIIFIFVGYYPSVYWIQLLYYFGCAVAFVLALSYATCAIVLFIRDLGQFISVFMQVFMWATPIMWNISIVPEHFRIIFYLNPAYYIIVGYRDSLLYHISVFQRLGLSLYFWCVVIVLMIVGSTVFRKLRPHFADVL